MIVATAGHIDHGKTALVRALTGIDTDRLPEERRRGISIDLGFAYLQSESGLIGFVDVPGHERFVRNMLAGVAGIDLALLVVAADDGPMPQTLEHLQILHLLDVRQAVVAISKADRVPAARAEQVEREVGSLLAGTALKGAPMLRVSALRGDGVEALRATLAGCARTLRTRWRDDHPARLAVDRVFSVAGTGTVATGTVFHGRIRRGDRLVVMPAGHAVRVRGLEIRGLAVESARAGERCALALAGVEAAQLRRGDWVADERLRATTQRIEVRLALAATEPEPLEHGAPVHLHAGTDALPARVSTPRAVPIAPGTSAWAHLVLERPILAVNGDRFIVRDPSGRRTLGGGVVLDPFAPRRRPAADRGALLAAMQMGDPARTLAELIALHPGGVAVAPFQQTFNLADERVDELLRDAGATVLGREPRLAVSSADLARLRDALVAEVLAFHREHPAALGMEVRDLHRVVSSPLAVEPLTAVLRELAAAGRIVLRNGLASPPRHDATANPADDRLWARVSPLLQQAGFSPPTCAELAQTLRTNPAALSDFLHRKSKTGELCKVGDDRFYTRRSIARLAAIAGRVAAARSDGLFTAAEFRDAVGIGRRLSIRVLEFLDGAGVTRRVGDARRFRADRAAVFGPADDAPRTEPARAEG